MFLCEYECSVKAGYINVLNLFVPAMLYFDHFDAIMYPVMTLLQSYVREPAAVYTHYWSKWFREHSIGEHSLYLNILCKILLTYASFQVPDDWKVTINKSAIRCKLCRPSSQTFELMADQILLVSSSCVQSLFRHELDSEIYVIDAKGIAMWRCLQSLLWSHCNYPSLYFNQPEAVKVFTRRL
jgi:hypothetical protein